MEKETPSSTHSWATTGIVIGILAGVFPMTWFIKATFLFVAALLIIYDAAGSGRAIGWSKKKKIIVSLIIAIVMTGVGWYPVSEQWKIDHNTIFVSPKEITIVKHSNKNVMLSVTNNEDQTIYDICLGVCVSEEELSPALIDIKPLVGDAFPPLYLSNKCIALLFGGVEGINSHTTKNCYQISINGEKLTKNVNVSFGISSSSKEPSLIEGGATEDQMRNPPPNAKEFFSDEIKPGDKSGTIIMQRGKLPENPYFPMKKIDPTCGCSR